MGVHSGEIGIGPTEVLGLRVSVAALARVTLPHPETEQKMLALERKATFRLDGAQGEVIAQPFGGGVRILQPERLCEQMGDFHYDSLRSREEQDFRILIRGADWNQFKQFCLSAFRAAVAENGGDAAVLEADPARELAEEFEDTLQVALSAAQYRLKPLELLVENEPVPTHSPRAPLLPTVRIYVVDEADLLDAGLIRRVQANSTEVSDEELAERAAAQAQQSGRGRANAALTLAVEELTEAYRSLPAERRSETITFRGHRLAGNTSAVLGSTCAPIYERFLL